MRKSGIAVAAVAAALFFASGVAVAVDLLCTAPSSGGTWHNVLVPAGASCTLTDTRVTGNVTVQAGGALLITTFAGNSTVNGDVKGDGCDSIDLESTGLTGHIVVGGNLTIQNCTSPSFVGGRGSSFCPPVPPQNLLIGGNVKCNNNPGGCVFDYAIISGNIDCSGNFGCELESDAIGKNANINNNSNGPILNNSEFGGDVKCNGNSAAASGTGNTVAGNKSGQCSAI